jgi:hypothetical protein
LLEASVRGVVEASIHAFDTILAVVPAATRKNKLADFCHIAWSQAQSASGIGVSGEQGAAEDDRRRESSPLARIHSKPVMPRGSNNTACANVSRGRPVALRTMADTSVSAPVL